MNLGKARKILGKTGEKFSDEQIDALISQFSGIAEILVNIVGSKETTKGLDLGKKKEDYGNN